MPPIDPKIRQMLPKVNLYKHKVPRRLLPLCVKDDKPHGGQQQLRPGPDKPA